MTLEEAIEIKERELAARSHYPDSKLKQADRLGIEAMKRLELARKDFGYIDPSLLPGETEE